MYLNSWRRSAGALTRKVTQRGRVVGLAQGMCRETAGVERTSLKIVPQSSSFS